MVEGLPDVAIASQWEFLSALGAFFGSFVGALYLVWMGREKFTSGKNNTKTRVKEIVRPGAAVIDGDGGAVLAGALDHIALQMIESRQQSAETAEEGAMVARQEAAKLRELLADIAKERSERAEALRRLLADQHERDDRVYAKLIDVLEQVRRDLQEVAREMRHHN